MNIVKAYVKLLADLKTARVHIEQNAAQYGLDALEHIDTAIKSLEAVLNSHTAQPQS